MQIIDGKAKATEIKVEIRLEADAVIASGRRAPHLLCKIKDCEEVGFRPTLVRFEEDVDGFQLVNVGRTIKGLHSSVSGTPFGINELIKRYGFETSGKNCVVVGQSNIVGRPMTKVSLLSNTLFSAKGNIYN